MYANQKRHLKTGHHQRINIDKLVPYSDHPFKLYTGERLDAMVSSIKEFGVIMPVIVRYIKKTNGEFEILSGHNRVNAAKLAGYDDVPVIVKNELTEDEAKLIVTETNLMQRSFSDLSHSERAISLARHYNIMKHQGKRNDLLNEIEALLTSNESCVQVEHMKSRDKIGGEYGLSATNVTRYIRLSKLIPALLEHVDSGEIAFNSAYQLSFIEDENIQNQIAEFIKTGFKIDMKKAVFIRECYKNGTLTVKNIERILSNKNSSERKPIKLSAEIINSFFSAEQGKNEILEIIVKALQFYYDSQDEIEEDDDDDDEDDDDKGDESE